MLAAKPSKACGPDTLLPSNSTKMAQQTQNRVGAYSTSDGKGGAALCVRKPLPTLQHRSALPAVLRLLVGSVQMYKDIFTAGRDRACCVQTGFIPATAAAALLKFTPSEETSATSGQEMQGYGTQTAECGADGVC